MSDGPNDGAARRWIAWVSVVWLALGSAAGAAEGSVATLGGWTHYGRGTARPSPAGMVVTDGWVASQDSVGDGEFRFAARAVPGQPQVQIWAGIRGRDRDHRYVVGLRGGNNDDLYLARYAPDGGDRFLGLVPLEFHPQVGQWYALRIVAVGKRFQIYLGDERRPRLDVTDPDAAWDAGSALLGGGWLATEFKDVSVSPADASALVVPDAPPPPDVGARRAAQRAEYRPLVVASIGAGRQAISLDGNWLFAPDGEVSGRPESPGFDDQPWHVLDVPNFWKPMWAWLYGEPGLPYGKGISDRYRTAELARVGGYTFDWRTTNGGWYRHHVTLPAEVAGRHLSLDFDAIAKIAAVYVNGVRVGEHVGMFGPVSCDASAAFHPGENVVAVHVLRNRPGRAEPDRTEGVAVTVPVTSAMLRSIPHGMYDDDPAGIWQPARLTVTDPLRADDVWVRPTLTAAEVDVTVANGSASPRAARVAYAIRDAGDGSVLHAEPAGEPVVVPASGTAVVHLRTPALRPRPWSPATPNLYAIDVTVSDDGGRATDVRTTRFGFRTFGVAGGQLMLNGRPYWLRGGDHFPSPLRPNDAALARRFMQVAHDGNVRVTRSHVAPMTDTWLDAADEVGAGVSYEGTWPWLMLKGEVPDESLLAAWRDEMAALVRRERNHPSVLMWTVNNEMKFYDTDRRDPALLKRKWAVASDMVGRIRAADPTRPVVADSAYVRREVGDEYRDLIAANHFDDGDLDDAHRYYGWYNESFMHLMGGAFGRGLATPGRPLISQEMSTGYPRNDDGHPARFYLFQHGTPQALVGLDAYETADPAVFLERQAMMTKELAEAIRRSDRGDCAGVLHFAYTTWFRDAWRADRIEPFPTATAVRTALQPVLVSAELFGRHFYAGTTVTPRLCVCNDDEGCRRLSGMRVAWRVTVGGRPIVAGQADVPPVDYYANGWVTPAIALPEALPAPRVDAKLGLTLLDGAGRVWSENSYDLAIATHAWADAVAPNDVAVLGSMGPAFGGTAVKTVADATGFRALVVTDPAGVDAAGWAGVLRFAHGGGRVLVLNGGDAVVRLLPDQVTAFHAKSGEIATMHVPESPAFDGLAWRDLAWWQAPPGAVPVACHGVYAVDRSRADVAVLADQCDLHGYCTRSTDIVRYSGTPLVRVAVGRGWILASAMATDAAGADPIAGRLLRNVVAELGRE